LLWRGLFLRVGLFAVVLVAFFLIFGQREGGAAGRRTRLLDEGLLARAVRLTVLAAIVLRILRILRVLWGLRILLLVLLLLRLGHRHDAEIVLGMLQVIFGHDPVAGGIGVTCQLQVLLVHMRGRTADFDLGTAGIEGPIGVVATATASSAVPAAHVSVMTVLRPAAASPRALHICPFVVGRTHAVTLIGDLSRPAREDARVTRCIWNI